MGSYHEQGPIYSRLVLAVGIHFRVILLSMEERRSLVPASASSIADEAEEESLARSWRLASNPFLHGVHIKQAMN